MSDATNNIVKLLEDLVIQSEEFRQLGSDLSYFCPFEAMGMMDQEIRHASFLSYILDPSKPHGFDDAYLRAFLNIATEKGLGRNIYLRPIDVHFLDLSNVKIVREKQHVDLRIELQASRTASNKPVVMIFELKINAIESPSQLKEYFKTMQSEYPDHEVLFFYITKNGDDPSEENLETWIPFSLRDVVSSFEKVMKRGIGRADARETVRAYLAMMRRIHVGDQEEDALTLLAQDLWIKHKNALDFLVDRKPDSISGLLKELYTNGENFCQELEKETNVTFKVEKRSNKIKTILYPANIDDINKKENDERFLVLWIDRQPKKSAGKKQEILRARFIITEAGSESDAERRRALYEDNIKAFLMKGIPLSPVWHQISNKEINMDPKSEGKSARSRLNEVQRVVVNFVKSQELWISKISPKAGEA